MWVTRNLIGENLAILHVPTALWSEQPLKCQLTLSPLSSLHSLWPQMICFSILRPRAKGLSFFGDLQLGFLASDPQRLCGYHSPMNIHLPGITSLGPGPPDSHASPAPPCASQVSPLTSRPSREKQLYCQPWAKEGWPEESGLHYQDLNFQELRGECLALVLVAPLQWVAFPMLNTNSKAWGAGRQSPADAPRLSE